MSKKQINAQKSANQSTQSTQSNDVVTAESVQPNAAPEVQRDSVKKVLTEEQKRKRLEYHKKYEAAHKEQVKAWHKAYYERKREEKRKKKEEQAWIEERINAGKKGRTVKVTKTPTSATFTETIDNVQPSKQPQK